VINGDSPGGEPISKAFDDNTNTKWLDFNLGDCGGSVTMTFNVDLSANSYTFFTGNDASERDPTAWTLEICSPNNSGSTSCVSETITDAEAPENRKTSYPIYTFVSADVTTVETTTTTTTAKPTTSPTNSPTNSPTDSPTTTTTTTTTAEPTTSPTNSPTNSPTTTTTTAEPTNSPTNSPTDSPTPVPTPAPSTTTTTTTKPSATPTPVPTTMEPTVQATAEENLATMCACVAKYDFCQQECSVYTESIASDDSTCFDAFVNVVCIDGVDGSFFGTPYYQICPEQCTLTCDADATTDEYVQCLKMRIEVLESRVDGLETSSQEQEETISTLKGQCDTVQEALGTCGTN